MADDPLNYTRAFHTAVEDLAIALLADGAAPASLADRLEIPHAAGSVVVDPVTGQEGVVLHVGVQDSPGRGPA